MAEAWPDLAGRLHQGAHRLPVRVYYEDTDAGGVVYHARYVAFCERARSDWLRLLGINQSELPDLFFVVRDAVEAIDAFLAEGRDVVVHCHGGRSRTGLVLKAWYMAREGATHAEAHNWLRGEWEHYETWTQSFWDFLDNEWTAHVGQKGA